MQKVTVQRKGSGFTPLDSQLRPREDRTESGYYPAKFTSSIAPMRRKSLAGFTLIEILIVVAIIAILALAIIPNYIGFDVDARVVTTKSNLSTIRNRISLYRAKEGGYPASLRELLEKTYSDAGIEKPYLKQIPAELITEKSGNSSFQDQESKKSFSNTGGWVYVTDKADVFINHNKKLDKAWEDYEGENPSEW